MQRPSFRPLTLLAVVALAATAGCAPPEPEASAEPAPAPAAAAPSDPAARQAFFGDLHIHTRYSFDAFIFNTRSTPDDAYKFARGEAIDHPAGFKIQLESGPLDFAAVTDHSEYLGVMQNVYDHNSKLYPLEISKQMRGETGLSKAEIFQSVIPKFATGEPIPELYDEDVMRSAWSDEVASAERNNQPGKFTTFIGYEYTSAPDVQNLHRNVIFRTSKAPVRPFTSLDSQNPEDLWRFLDAQRKQGIEALAIPHNSNGSNGQMFKLADWAGNPFDAGYVDLRSRNEPLVEITQTKGTSETHPMNSPNDEWASFQIFPLRIASRLPSDVPGSYVREALLHGIEMQEKSGLNPWKLGFVGGSDSHVSGGSFEESNFWSAGGRDSSAQQRGSVPLDAPAAAGAPTANPSSSEPTRATGTTTLPNGRTYGDGPGHLYGTAGLTGVWAEENTRDSIYDALRRKETFATSGPRIRVRFFGGFALPDNLAEDAAAVAKAYAQGVPMGGDLMAETSGAGGAAGTKKAPKFLVWAMRDAKSAALQRVQVVKGWVENGKGQERVYDVACSDHLTPDPKTHRCPDNGATVDVATCKITEGKGAGELRTVWTDPDFDPSQRAFYYLRALENPTCRWSTWDAIRAHVEPRPDVAATIQERAWSSPIWYAPGPRAGGG
jgi:hypothetical protein